MKDNIWCYVSKHKHYKLVLLAVLKLWTVMLHFSEDNSEEVRNSVWRLMNNNANCAKSFELFFDKFVEHYDTYPAAILVVLLCWSYLDIELPQDRLEVHRLHNT